jgi:hypothetical protein
MGWPELHTGYHKQSYNRLSTHGVNWHQPVIGNLFLPALEAVCQKTLCGVNSNRQGQKPVRERFP